MITHDEVRKVFKYDEHTGVFRWAIRQGCKKPGQLAGHLDKNLGYVTIRYRNKLYLAHRLAWLYITGSHPAEQIDHINGVRHDNRFINLRPATNSENNQNKNMTKSNKTGEKGVHWHKKAGKWSAEVWCNYKKHYIGLFSDFNEAVIAVRNKRQKLHKEFVNHG